MSDHSQLENWVDDATALAEFIETVDERDVPTETLASTLKDHVWERDIPLERAVRIVERERERVNEYESVSLNQSSRAPRYMDLQDLALLSGFEFEHVLAEILRRVEGEAIVTEASGDQGVDVVWEREETTVGIQAKAYDLNNPVSNSAVQEIHTGSAVMDSEYSIDIPAVVTTSRYTEGAKEAARVSDVRLYGRSHLEQWLSEAELDAEAMGNTLESI